MGVQYPNSIPTIMQAIAATVETNILADLQDYQSTIEAVTFFAGNWTEIGKRMASYTKSPTLRTQKFPCIILVEDISIDRRNTQFFGEAELNIVIAHYTTPELTSLEREPIYANVLRPIYYELCKQMYKHGAFGFKSERDVKGIYTEHKYWGAEDYTKQKLGDYIEAIEIRNLNTVINWKWCEETINQNL